MLNDSVREISDDEMDRLAGGTGKARPHADQDACLRCGVCEDNCPKRCITVTHEAVTIRFDLCDGCGICASGCPMAAISMY